MAWPNFVQIKNGWPAIDIGRMRHSISIQQLLPSAPPIIDASGQVESWQQVLPLAGDLLMAAIEVSRSAEAFKGGQTTAQSFFSIGFWFQAGVVPGMRVVNENGTVCVIESVNNILEMNIVLVLTCIALGAGNQQ